MWQGVVAAPPKDPAQSAFGALTTSIPRRLPARIGSSARATGSIVERGKDINLAHTQVPFRAPHPVTQLFTAGSACATSLVSSHFLTGVPERSTSRTGERLENGLTLMRTDRLSFWRICAAGSESQAWNRIRTARGRFQVRLLGKDCLLPLTRITPSVRLSAPGRSGPPQEPHRSQKWQQSPPRMNRQSARCLTETQRRAANSLCRPNDVRT